MVIARDLLTESGSVFVQIGDENVHLVRCLLDEVFGSENFVSLVTFRKTSSATTDELAGISDYLLWYPHERSSLKYRQLYYPKRVGGLEVVSTLGWRGLMAFDGHATNEELELPPEHVRFLRPDQLTSQRPPGDFPVVLDGVSYRPAPGYWKTNQEGMDRP